MFAPFPAGNSLITPTFLGFETINSAAASYTFSTIPFSTANSNRWLVACVMWQASVITALSSVVIGGVAATQLVIAPGTINGVPRVAMVAAKVTSNSTPTVVLNLAASALRVGCSLYELHGVGSSLNTSTASSSATGQTYSGLNVPYGGAIIACAMLAGSGLPSSSWSGITEDCDAAVDGQRSISSASKGFTADSPSLTVTNSTSATSSASGALALFSP